MNESGPAGGTTVRVPRSWNPPVKAPIFERVDLRQLWQVAAERWRSILACALVVVTSVSLITMFGRMNFKTRGSLYLGELQDKAGLPVGQSDQLDVFGGRSGDVGTEIEILKSGDLLKRAVLATGLNVRLAPEGWTAPRYWRWRLGQRDLELLDRGARTLSATNVTLRSGASRPEDFVLEFLTSETYSISRAGQPLGVGSLGREFSSADLRMTLMPGQREKPTAGARYEMTVTPLDQVVELVNHRLTVGMPKSIVGAEPIKVISLEFLHTSPRAAAAFVTTLMQTYLDRRQSWK
ncbi:MAG TPA: hypothetical protein VHU40_13825, partial [Polyangia bacterium]|nr:hypothetical protein [Polyangia bacterium]